MSPKAIATRHLVLDDGLTIQNPAVIRYGRGGEPLSSDNKLRGGDTVNNLAGDLSFGFGDYRIQPTSPVDFQPTNPRPAEPVGGSLKVVSFNVLNFFTTIDNSGLGSGPNDLEPRGADSDIYTGGEGADIFALMVGDGVSVINDFEAGIDQIGLQDGLRFGQLYRVQDGANTAIGTFEGELLAVAANADASQFGAHAFVSV